MGSGQTVSYNSATHTMCHILPLLVPRILVCHILTILPYYMPHTSATHTYILPRYRAIGLLTSEPSRYESGMNVWLLMFYSDGRASPRWNTRRASLPAMKHPQDPSEARPPSRIRLLLLRNAGSQRYLTLVHGFYYHFSSIRFKQSQHNQWLVSCMVRIKWNYDMYVVELVVRPPYDMYDGLHVML